MVKIILDGKFVSSSQNLRGITRYSANHAIDHAVGKRLPDGKGFLSIVWSNGATCEVPFESYSLLCLWLNLRRDWIGYRHTEEMTGF